MRGKVWSLAIGNELNITHGECLYYHRLGKFPPNPHPHPLGPVASVSSALLLGRKDTIAMKLCLLRVQVTLLQEGETSVTWQFREIPAFFLKPLIFPEETR